MSSNESSNIKPRQINIGDLVYAVTPEYTFTSDSWGYIGIVESIHTYSSYTSMNPLKGLGTFTFFSLREETYSFFSLSMEDESPISPSEHNVGLLDFEQYQTFSVPYYYGMNEKDFKLLTPDSFEEYVEYFLSRETTDDFMKKKFLEQKAFLYRAVCVYYNMALFSSPLPKIRL